MISEHAMYLFPVWQLSGISFVVVHHDKKWELRKKKNWKKLIDETEVVWLAGGQNSWELLSKVGNK